MMGQATRLKNTVTRQLFSFALLSAVYYVCNDTDAEHEARRKGGVICRCKAPGQPGLLNTHSTGQMRGGNELSLLALSRNRRDHITRMQSWSWQVGQG